jgi:hypothetical protein
VNYAVVWEPAAENELAAIWVAAPDQRVITNRAFRIEQALATSPFTVGRRRNASVNRTLLDPPLGVDYEIIEDDKKVRVLRVWAVS